MVRILTMYLPKNNTIMFISLSATMRSLFLSTLLFTSSFFARAQNLHLTVFGGSSNYQGDLQGRRFSFNQAKGAIGVGVLYELSDKLFIRAGFTYAKVAADDKKSPLNANRNLSFSSPISELHLGLEYDLVNNYEHSFTPFIFAGIATFGFNPSAIDNLGNRVDLQPLGTEGQGFYLGRKRYSLRARAIPIGGGIKLALSDDIHLRFETGLRILSTDYLDDVSTTLADKNDLLINNGQKAVDMAFRGSELKPPLNYPAAGAQRGNPKVKDYYYFTGLGLSFRLSPKYDRGYGSGRTQLGCPKSVF